MSISARATPAFATYLGEINRTPRLTAAEEIGLAARVTDGDAEARDRMVRANLRLVVSIARQYTGKGLPIEDLVGEGNMGLMRAVEGFDPTMNTRFSTYGSFWIKQSITRAIANTAKTVRIPAYLTKLLARWRRATNTLTDGLGRAPTHEETAGVLGLSKKKIAIIKSAIRVASAGAQSDPSERSIEEKLMDRHGLPPVDELVETDDLKQALRLLKKMDPREATVLRMRFGLNDEEPKTLKMIGECLGLTRERVRQIEVVALGKLSDGMREGARSADITAGLPVSPAAALSNRRPAPTPDHNIYLQHPFGPHPNG